MVVPEMVFRRLQKDTTCKHYGLSQLSGSEPLALPYEANEMDCTFKSGVDHSCLCENYSNKAPVSSNGSSGRAHLNSVMRPSVIRNSSGSAPSAVIASEAIHLHLPSRSYAIIRLDCFVASLLAMT